MSSSVTPTPTLAEQMCEVDKQLSRRHINLDPAGYFIIYIDRDAQLIVAKHYQVTVNDRGLAIDPDTGKPLSAKGQVKTQLLGIYRGLTAKELCVELFETAEAPLVTHFNHAAYLGREFIRAEIALRDGSEYVQD